MQFTILTLHNFNQLKEIFYSVLMEKNIWTSWEDKILKILRQQRKIQRWTDIARTLADQYKIKGKNGKNCRQRYQERFDVADQNTNWSYKEEKIMFDLHNQLGNKWAIISRKMNGRSDNAIKNRFYSRLRKGLKTINSQALEKLGNSYKQIKFTAIFKIIEATEDGYKDNRFCQIDTSKLCFDLKNKLIILSYDENEEHDYHPETVNCVEIYYMINDFCKNYKRKPKKFRRIPTKSTQIQLNYQAQQNDNSQNEEFQEDNMGNSDKSSISQEQNKVIIENEQCFNDFKQENYKISEIKPIKKRRVSAQTVEVQSVLVYSGILEQEFNLPLLGLTKKRTSYFDLLNEQFQKQNMFLDESDQNPSNFFLKDLMSMKRLSQTDDRFFD